MDFITRLPVSTNWKDKTYDSIFMIVNKLTKIVHFKSVKINIDALSLAKVMIEVVMWHLGLPDSIVSD